jgi:hypothetical protein
LRSAELPFARRVAASAHAERASVRAGLLPWAQQQRPAGEQLARKAKPWVPEPALQQQASEQPERQQPAPAALQRVRALQPRERRQLVPAATARPPR